ncbi:DUF4192 domain-containing protein [Saccharopolyspora taberi]|uniref:DUF4192 domain-containing protein n=1 Tax=Saccharopolyspora taberi TaxID=60895 RepID=A0ABN3VFM5_9PSEU
MLITLRSAPNAARFGVTLRIDLPGPGQEQDIAHHLILGPMRSHRVDSVILVVVGESCGDPPDLPGGSPPHGELIDSLREVLAATGIPVTLALWTPEIAAGKPWSCYGSGVRGVLPDPKISPVGTVTAAAGSVTFESRKQLEDLVTPEPAEHIARRAARLDVLTEEREEHPTSARQDLELVRGAVRRTAEGSALTEDDHLQVLLAVSDSRVRDLALGLALGDTAHAAEQLWLTLVRKAPAPEIADVAALLAFSAYLRGDGPLAGIALDRAESARPEHSLTRLLRQALDIGFPVEKLVTVAREAAEDAEILIKEDGAW